MGWTLVWARCFGFYPHSRERQVPFGCDSRTMHTKDGRDVLTLAWSCSLAVLIRVFSEGWAPGGKKALSTFCSPFFHSFIHSFINAHKLFKGLLCAGMRLRW